jgi:hypothetical protein
LMHVFYLVVMAMWRYSQESLSHIDLWGSNPQDFIKLA